MALQLPFLSKKKEPPKSVSDLHGAYLKAKIDLDSELGKLSKKDPIAARLAQYGLATPKVDKKGNITGFDGQESFEKYQHRVVKTEFPEPDRRFRLVLEYPNYNIEQTYYWFIRYLSETWGFNKVHKVIDTMASSAASSNFANIQTRLSAQQNQASQYLKGISEMIKGLFQIVRELRIIDERLQYYYDSDGNSKGIKSSALSSEIVLKGLWIDQVEGGAKNPGSVYGLAQTVGFTILPDLFFRVRIKNRKTLEAEVEKLKFNEKVKEVLKRKLRQYYEWKWRTKQELEVRRQFEIKYLRQHYDVIKLYMSWAKPYLRNIRRLQLYEKNMEHPEIVHAFETQIIELEALFVRDDFGPAAAVVSVHIFYRVKPELGYHSYEYQHKGPIYTGMADITIRSYHWSDDKIQKYLEYRQNDDLELMSNIDNSVSEAMHALGDDLKKYLKEADPTMIFPGEKPPESQEMKKEFNVPDFLDPFVSIFRGFGEIAQGFTGAAAKKAANKGKKPEKTKKKKPKRIDSIKKHRAEHFAIEAAWEAYYRYKMGPGGNIYWVE